jgi:hypothetical protein
MNYVQEVPEHCDRITWRGSYYHLPLITPSTVLLHDEIASLKTELETERIRLAACGVIAMANTRDSAAKYREMHPDYESASAHDVAIAVDREMDLREQLAECKKLMEEATEYLWCIDSYASSQLAKRMVAAISTQKEEA